MIDMQGRVQVVPNARLSASWASATSADGKRVVFVRRSDWWLIHSLMCSSAEHHAPEDCRLTRKKQEK